MIYWLFMLGIAVIVWGVPALVCLFAFKVPVLQSLLFGFLFGSLLLGILEALGILANSVKRLTKKKSRKP
ncbi:MAG: hypothetical protein FJ405_04940 [Verrucomicrobia bacterium]|nr:hypothetical protein [Verrucomicrobiota bacterium]